MLALLQSLIIPTIECCCPLWTPPDQANIKTLEQMQRSFTKRMEDQNKHPLPGLEQEKHPILGPSETPPHLQPGEKKGEIHHHIHLEGVKRASSQAQTIDREEGIMLTLLKHKGKASIWQLHERNILCQGVRLFCALSSHLRKLQ